MCEYLSRYNANCCIDCKYQLGKSVVRQIDIQINHQDMTSCIIKVAGPDGGFLPKWNSTTAYMKIQILDESSHLYKLISWGETLEKMNFYGSVSHGQF